MPRETEAEHKPCVRGTQLPLHAARGRSAEVMRAGTAAVQPRRARGRPRRDPAARRAAGAARAARGHTSRNQLLDLLVVHVYRRSHVTGIHSTRIRISDSTAEISDFQ